MFFLHVSTLHSTCSVLLQLLRTIGSNMHYSFGNDKELPHIVFPAHDAMDHVIVTKPGQQPPKLGEPFLDATSQNPNNWNCEDTYSMSFRSARVDLPSWRMVNLGVLQDALLETYWGKSKLRLVIYENCGDEQRHVFEENNYLLALQVENTMSF